MTQIYAKCVNLFTELFQIYHDGCRVKTVQQELSLYLDPSHSDIHIFYVCNLHLTCTKLQTEAFLKMIREYHVFRGRRGSRKSSLAVLPQRPACVHNFVNMNANTVSFPSISRANTARSLILDPSTSNLSYHLKSALEICDLIYGSSSPSWQAIERFYDPSATYENPFITATSRSAIADLHTLSASLANVNVPKPSALLYRLLGIPIEGWNPTLFQAVSMWHEISDVCESESFGASYSPMIVID